MSLKANVEAAAHELAAARCPVVTGLASDVAGIKAAISLARRLGCSFDHQNSAATQSELAVMQRTGWMMVSPAEVARNCDLLLVAGKIGSDKVASLFGGRTPPQAIVLSESGIAVDLAVLRALVSGVPQSRFGAAFRKLSRLARQIEQARFGVAIWEQGVLPSPVVEMLMGLVRDLNEKTRFSAFALTAEGNATGADIVSAWQTGYPVRTSLASEPPEHDPWIFSAERMIRSGEVDTVLWLSTLGIPAPDWLRRLPTVAIVARGTALRHRPHVLIEVGMPGRDHDGIVYQDRTGALGVLKASAPNNIPTAAQAIGMIEVELVRLAEAA